MKHYSKEFKEEALKLSDEIGVKKAAQQLGVAYYTLADWRSIPSLASVRPLAHTSSARLETSADFPPRQSLPLTRGSIQPCGSPANTTASETVCPNEGHRICDTLFGWRLHQRCFTIRR